MLRLLFEFLKLIIGGAQTLSLKILKLTLAVSIQFCALATLWIMSVTQIVIDDDLAFPILQFLYHFVVAETRKRMKGG